MDSFDRVGALGPWDLGGSGPVLRRHGLRDLLRSTGNLRWRRMRVKLLQHLLHSILQHLLHPILRGLLYSVLCRLWLWRGRLRLEWPHMEKRLLGRGWLLLVGTHTISQGFLEEPIQK
jgi:hypothetical protein